MRAVIIDDEPRAREAIVQMVSIYCKNVEIIDQAGDVRSGIQSIKKHLPDLVFLDIKMPDGSGFDLLRQIGTVNFRVIFITAYEQYALKAIKFNAIEYLLKPIDPDELIIAVNKAMDALEKENYGLKIQELLNQLDLQQKYASGRKLILRTWESIHLVNTNDIITIESDKNYSVFYLADRQKIVISRTIKEFLTALNGLSFFRVHNSYIINLQHIKRLNREDSVCIMTDGSEIPVSYRKREELIDLFSTL